MPPAGDRREEHARENASLRKQSADREASLRRDLDQARGSVAALRDANLSLEGAAAGLVDREAALESDLRERTEESERVMDEVSPFFWGGGNVCVEYIARAPTNVVS